MPDLAPEPLERFAAVYIAVRQLLANSAEAQWQAGRTPIPREDTTERSKGFTSDPTSTITADARRLQLRASVVAAELALIAAEKTLAAVHRHLSDALKKWQG